MEFPGKDEDVEVPMDTSDEDASHEDISDDDSYCSADKDDDLDAEEDTPKKLAADLIREKPVLSIYKSHRNTNRSLKFWGLKVKSGESPTVKVDEDFFIHISRATSDGGKMAESALLYVSIDDKKFAIGTLAQGVISVDLNVDFDKDFQLSHNLDSGSLHFTGYKASKKKANESTRLPTKEDLEEAMSKKFTSKPLVKTSYQKENPYSDSDSEDVLDWPTHLLMSNIDKGSTREDIMSFFEKENLTVAVEKVGTDIEDDSKLLAIIKFSSTADLKIAKKLNGGLLGKTSVFFESYGGNTLQFIVYGFECLVDKKYLTDFLEKSFTPFGTIRKIYVPKDEEDYTFGLAYVIMDVENPVENVKEILKLNETKMGEHPIYVEKCDLQNSVTKRLFSSNDLVC